MFEKAQRMSAFKKSVFQKVLDEKKEYEKNIGFKAIDLSLGSPDIAPDKKIIETIQKEAGIAKNYKYAVKALPEMIQAVQEWYKNRYSVELDEEEIALLQGSQEALVNLPLVMCNPGEVIFIPNPYYPIYEQAPALAQAKVLFMPLTKENNYLIDLDAIDPKEAQNAKMMLVSYPNNPTGAVADDAFYLKLIDFAKKYNILVVHDNAYSDLVFDSKEGKSFLSYPHAKEVGVELNSFSKSYGMAGARLGVLVGNKEVIAYYKDLKSNLDYGIFLPVQYAGIEALKHGGKEIEKTRKIYERRRDLLHEGLKKAGWDIPKNKATMFMWAPVPKGYSSGEDFALDLLKKAGVIVTPGSSFGSEGKDYVRIALVQDDKVLLEAVTRIANSSLFK